MGVASMVIGIIAVVIGFIPFCGAWAVVPAIIGLGLGIADLVVKTRRGDSRGMAIAGVVLNPVAIVVIVGWYFLFVYGATQAMEDAQWQLQQGMQPGAQPPFPAQPSNAPPGWPQPSGSSSPPLQPMQPMEPMQPVDPGQPAPPDTAGVRPQPVPVQPPASPP
jgi:hypothetical protein